MASHSWQMPPGEWPGWSPAAGCGGTPGAGIAAEHPPALQSRPRAPNLLEADFSFLLSFPLLIRCSACSSACRRRNFPCGSSRVTLCFRACVKQCRGCPSLGASVCAQGRWTVSRGLLHAMCWGWVFFFFSPSSFKPIHGS